MKKCRILYITRKYPPMVGGMENFSYNLYTGLSENNNIDIKLISLGKKQKNLIWFVPYALFYTLVNASKYDIIFIGDAVLSIIGFLAKIFYKKRVIINVFGLDITHKNWLYQFYLKCFYNCFDKYITISHETDDLLQKRGIYDSVIITPGVNCDYSQKNGTDWEELCQRHSINKSDTVLITVGRLVKRKGAEWFIRNVMPLLKNKPIKYLIVGVGESEQNIRKAISEYDLDDQVKLLGKVNEEDLVSLYKNSNIFVMPNISIEGDAEGFGIVAVEASASGLIVLASGIEGIKDAIIDGKNGFLMQSGNTDQYFKKIIDIVHNPDYYKSLAPKFKEYTQVNYSWEHICSKYIDLFKKMLESER